MYSSVFSKVRRSDRRPGQSRGGIKDFVDKDP